MGEAWSRRGNAFALTGSSSASFTHPQQGLLSLRLVLVASRLDALAHRLWEQLLVLDLPQVLVCLLALLLQGSAARGGSAGQGTPASQGEPWVLGAHGTTAAALAPAGTARPSPIPPWWRRCWVCIGATPTGWGRRQVRSRAVCRTSYSFCASNRRAPGAMEAILKISWLASAGGKKKKYSMRGCPRAGE